MHLLSYLPTSLLSSFQTMNFLALPREIRDQIYREAICTRDPLDLRLLLNRKLSPLEVGQSAAAVLVLALIDCFRAASPGFERRGSQFSTHVTKPEQKLSRY